VRYGLAGNRSTEPSADSVEQRYESLFEMAPAGLIFADLDGRMIRANGRAAAVFGCTPAELEGRLVSDFYPELPSGKPLAMGIRKRWQAGETLDDYEYQIRRADGRLRWIRVSVIPVTSPKRGVIAALTAVADVTEERVTAEDLREAKDYAEALLHTSNAMVVGLGPDGAIEVFNDAAVLITGYSRQELEGRNWFETLVPRDRYPQVWQEFERLMAGGIAREFENPILTKSGEERYIVWRNTELHQRGETVGTLSVGIDITDRKAVEQELEGQNRLLLEAQRRLEGLVEEKNRFIATVSHELRTPLSGVLGFASELRSSAGAFTTDEIVEFAGLIHDGCVSANNLVEDLLAAARIDMGQITLTREPVDLCRAALAVVGEREVATNLVGKDLREGTETAIAWGDLRRVRQILRNLLVNAGRYGGPHIVVRSGLRADPPIAFLRVTDDGPGVSDHLRETLFDPFQHGVREAGLTEPVGLGLYVSRTLARLMDGDLTYRRQEDTTVFELTLPATDQAAVA
jgi:PAS domain S-box-containing protein